MSQADADKLERIFLANEEHIVKELTPIISGFLGDDVEFDVYTHCAYYTVYETMLSNKSHDEGGMNLDVTLDLVIDSLKEAANACKCEF